MKDGTTTNEKLRAIERWENEGGKVSPAALVSIPDRTAKSAASVNRLANRGYAQPRPSNVLS